MKDTRLLKMFNDTKDVLCKYDYYIHTAKRILHLTNTELKIPHLMGLQYVGRPNQYAGDFGVYAVKKGRITLESLEKLVKADTFETGLSLPFTGNVLLLFKVASF